MHLSHSDLSRAKENLRSSIRKDILFPQNVFSEEWREFLFFDPDWVIDEDFVDWVKAILEEEGSRCACLSRLDISSSHDSEVRDFFIGEETTRNEFRKLLIGASPGRGWINDMGQFACVSDAAEWCIYLERAEELAVIAFKSPKAIQQYRSLLVPLNAVPIALAIHGLLSPEALSEQWKRDIVREYECRSN